MTALCIAAATADAAAGARLRGILGGHPALELVDLLSESTLYIPLLSADALEELGDDLSAALARERAGTLRVLPVRLRAVDLGSGPLAALPLLCGDGEPLARRAPGAALKVCADLIAAAAAWRLDGVTPRPQRGALRLILDTLSWDEFETFVADHFTTIRRRYFTGAMNRMAQTTCLLDHTDASAVLDALLREPAAVQASSLRLLQFEEPPR